MKRFPKMSPLRRALLDRLARAESWLSRPALCDGLDSHEALVDEELADLVALGWVFYNQRGREYRLAGEMVARRALRLLAGAEGTPRALVGVASARRSEPYRVGVAVRGTGPDGEPMVAMAQLELPALDLQGLLVLRRLVVEAPAS